MKKIVVSASSLPAGRNMSSQIEYIQRVGNFGADMYHLDVMDGKFVKTKSLDYTYFEQLRERSPLLFDVHLMIENPQNYVNKYIKAKSNIITVHVEAMDEITLVKTLKKIKKAGIMTGIAVDLDTDISLIDKYLDQIALVLILCVKAGKGGQPFQKSALKKIKHVRELNPNILIEVDGGIDPTTGAQCVKAGADILVSGNYIYNNDAYQAIQGLKGKNG